MTSESEKPIEELSYEQAQAELEQIVSQLEGEENTLETTLQLYERGQALVKYCTELLEKAEIRVKKLSGEDLVDLDA